MSVKLNRLGSVVRMVREWIFASRSGGRRENISRRRAIPGGLYSHDHQQLTHET